MWESRREYHDILRFLFDLTNKKPSSGAKPRQKNNFWTKRRNAAQIFVQDTQKTSDENERPERGAAGAGVEKAGNYKLSLKNGVCSKCATGGLFRGRKGKNKGLRGGLFRSP